MAKPAVVEMETGSQRLARKIQGFGHTVRIFPAQVVKSYLKSNKSDTLDAEAIAEAVTRPTMRFVEVKEVEQMYAPGDGRLAGLSVPSKA